MVVMTAVMWADDLEEVWAQLLVEKLAGTMDGRLVELMVD